MTAEVGLWWILEVEIAA